VSDVWARIEHIDGDGTVFEILWDEKQLRTRTPLIGRHNVYNCLAAVCACRALGVELEAAAGALSGIQAVPGRLEQVESGAGYKVYVDYAHTDDALANAIGALRPIIPGRVIVVFGCGGDRDRTKRPRMAAVAQDLADVVVITSDNPRTEDPGAIIQDILEGIEGESRETVHVEQDRHKAIDAAVNMAGEGDCVLIAGKGHETEQLIGESRVYFNDVQEAREAVNRREGPG
jgi:UDP-N-acetylmuramoyl-L-alanyl-D-glutamate--2,6-diaminopimelate ligase